MVRINLLPWREERRLHQVRKFYAQLGAALAAGLALLGAWSMVVTLQQQRQDRRNAYLQSQLQLVDRRIAEIHDLQQVRSQWLERKRIIEQLQFKRSQMVHLFDALVRTTPGSVRLTSLKQAGDTMLLAGIAQSNASVAAYMRAIEASPWMGPATLMRSEHRQQNLPMPYQFSLSVVLRHPELSKNPPASSQVAGAGMGGQP